MMFFTPFLLSLMLGACADGTLPGNDSDSSEGQPTTDPTPEPDSPKAAISLENIPDGIENVRITAFDGAAGTYLDVTLDAENSSKTVEVAEIAENSGMELGYAVFSDDAESVRRSMRVEGYVKSGDEVSIVLDMHEDARFSTLTCSIGDRSTVSEAFVNVTKSGSAYEGTNPRYDVYVNDGPFLKALNVRKALVTNGVHNGTVWNDWTNQHKLRDTMSYVNVTAAFDGPEEIIVKRNDSDIADFDIRPAASVSSMARFGNDIVRFSLGGGDILPKVSVEFDGDRYHNLFIYGAKTDPDRDRYKNDPNTVFYGRGNHTPGLISLKDGQTLYVDDGAIVYGRVEITGSNISIRGRGVITGSNLPHYGSLYAEGPKLVITTGKELHTDIVIEGVTFVDSPNWTLCLSDIKGLTVKNVNIITHINNADGIDLQNCFDCEVSDCFIRTYDDNVSWKITTQYGGCLNDCYDIDMHDCLLWCDHARNIMVGPEAGQQGQVERSIHDCTFSDCTILESFGTSMSVRQDESSGYSAMPIRNITFRNIVLDDVLSSCMPVEVRQNGLMDPVCEMSGIHFMNITVNTLGGFKQSLVEDCGNSMSDILFENVSVNGTKMTGPGELMRVSGSVSPVFR